MLLRFGYMPHRVALWIYYQAVVLLWKGVPVHDIPERNVYASMVRERGAHANAAAADDRELRCGIQPESAAQGRHTRTSTTGTYLVCTY